MTDWSKAGEMLQSRAKGEAFLNSLTPEERAAVEADMLTMDTGKGRLNEAQKQVELAVRREWAAKIREEFGKYHKFGGGGDCEACGAIQGANFMDPDFIGYGPDEEKKA